MVNWSCFLKYFFHENKCYHILFVCCSCCGYYYYYYCIIKYIQSTENDNKHVLYPKIYRVLHTRSLSCTFHTNNSNTYILLTLSYADFEFYYNPGKLQPTKSYQIYLSSRLVNTVYKNQHRLYQPLQSTSLDNDLP